jgi:hypothetical protein
MTETKRNPSQSDRPRDAGGSSRERSIAAYESSRGKAGTARSPVGDNPLIALGGGLALGAVIAALIPTSRRERELVGPYADRLRDRASEAVTAAKDAGVARLDELGLTKDAGRDIVRQIIDGATDAAKTSAKAAAGAVKGE